MNETVVQQWTFFSPFKPEVLGMSFLKGWGWCPVTRHARHLAMKTQEPLLVTCEPLLVDSSIDE